MIKVKKNQYKNILFLLLAIVVCLLIFVSNTLSISYKEALNVFENSSLLSLLTKISLYLFGQNDIALRLPFIIFYLLSVILLYCNTKGFFRYQIDRYITTALFMFLPGVLSASLLVNSAIVVTFFTLLYLYIYQKTNKHNYYLLVLFLFVDNSFAILYLSLFFYAFYKKENTLFYFSLILFGLSMGIYGFNSGGKPKGFFVDTFAIYASIFSPFLFLYFFYSLYRVGFKGEKTLIWFISTTALVFSMLFSFRQHIYIEDFAPYVVISLPLMVKLFLHTYRVRLKEFRKLHNTFAILVLVTLSLNTCLTLFNKPLYLLLENPRKHLAYKYNIAKELSVKLKKLNINNINSEDKDLLLRLRFYDINKGKKYLLSKDILENYDFKIDIKYYGKIIDTYYIKKNEKS